LFAAGVGERLERVHGWKYTQGGYGLQLARSYVAEKVTDG
jgi:hypothetical protein